MANVIHHRSAAEYAGRMEAVSVTTMEAVPKEWKTGNWSDNMITIASHDDESEREYMDSPEFDDDNAVYQGSSILLGPAPADASIVDPDECIARSTANNTIRILLSDRVRKDNKPVILELTSSTGSFARGEIAYHILDVYHEFHKQDYGEDNDDYEGLLECLVQHKLDENLYTILCSS